MNSISQKNRWENNYNLLKLYINENGGNNWDQTLPQKFSKNGINLGQWFSRQKISFQKKKLSDERIKLLKNINFPFDNWKSRKSQNKNKWEKKYNIYLKNKNDIRVKKWISEQRKLYFSNKLKSERKELLVKSNFDWNGQNLRWKTLYKIAKNSKANNFKNNTVDISRWLNNELKNLNKLNQDKKKKILDLCNQ